MTRFNPLVCISRLKRPWCKQCWYIQYMTLNGIFYNSINQWTLVTNAMLGIHDRNSKQEFSVTLLQIKYFSYGLEFCIVIQTLCKHNMVNEIRPTNSWETSLLTQWALGRIIYFKHFDGGGDLVRWWYSPMMMQSDADVVRRWCSKMMM